MAGVVDVRWWVALTPGEDEAGCTGEMPMADLRQGATIAALDREKDPVAVGRLEAGLVIPGDDANEWCRFEFMITKVPVDDDLFYLRIGTARREPYLLDKDELLGEHLALSIQ